MERGMREQTENLIPIDDGRGPIVYDPSDPDSLIPLRSRAGIAMPFHGEKNWGEMGPWQENAYRAYEEARV